MDPNVRRLLRVCTGTLRFVAPLPGADRQHTGKSLVEVVLMPKVLWVALPLLLAVVALAVQVLRGRRPSRHAVNVWASLLLLGYVAATAGLGLFWVANQQLPVFDWHYLFGYGVVLLLVVHLVFNFPRVWRFITRRGATAGRAPPTVGPSRRGLLASLAALAAGAAVFTLGLRLRRAEPGLEAPRGSPAPAGAAASGSHAAALAEVERFHALSSNSRAGVLARAPAVDWGDPPAPFKSVAEASGTRLPAPGTARTTPFDRAALADILWHTAGVTAIRGGLQLRASPSSGALFSTELYAVVRSLPDLAAGLWHYDPKSHALVPQGPAAALAQVSQAVAASDWRDAPVWLVATAVFRRTGYKYRDRSYRYLLADLGHALENLCVAAAALGLGTRFIAAFDESRIAQALSVDEQEEGVLALVAVGTAGTVGGPGDAPTWRAATPVAGGGALGVTNAMHAATSLRVAAAAPAPDRAARAGIALPPATPVERDWLAAIARRRSVRRFSHAPLPLQVLSDLLWRMTRRPGPLLSAAVRVNLVVHRLAGVAPGSYRYEPDAHALLPRRVATSLRASARAAALDQDVIGDAAVVLVLSADRATLAAEALGPARGYRHALLEAGLVGERVYLEAEAHGLGACAVGAFYDDEAAALVAVDPAREWVLHFAALGVRA